jgi:hypothetical protein
MKNLAGNKECDHHIEDELRRAEIDIHLVNKPVHSEVPYNSEGRLVTKTGETVKFTRAWTYWVAVGNIPLDLAKKIYSHPEGKASVRAGGHCGCLPPDEQLVWLSKETGKELMNEDTFGEIQRIFSKHNATKTIEETKARYEVVKDKKTVGEPHVPCYHIDTQAGLLLFTQMVRLEEV